MSKGVGHSLDEVEVARFLTEDAGYAAHCYRLELVTGRALIMKQLATADFERKIAPRCLLVRKSRCSERLQRFETRRGYPL